MGVPVVKMSDTLVGNSPVNAPTASPAAASKEKALSETVGSFSFHSIPLAWKDDMIAIAQGAGIELEPLQYRIAQVCRSELGKLGVTGSKTGILSLTKGCVSWGVGTRHGGVAGGKSAPAAVRFVRECQAATAYLNEFTDATVCMSVSSVAFVTEHAKKAAEHAKAEAAKSATKK